MRLLCCGTSAGAFTAERASSGYVLQADGHTVMLDCGGGAFRNAMRFGISPGEIEAVFISHLHFDHIIDLATMAFFFGYNRQWSVPPIYGPPGLSDILSRIATLDTPGRNTMGLGEVIEVEGGDRRTVAGFEVWAEETPHARGSKSFARRFAADGKTVVFSGDTEANPALFSWLARDADLLLHECYSRSALERYALNRPPEMVQRIMTAIPEAHCEVNDTARVACEAAARRLVLTHLLSAEEPEALKATASSIYDGPITVAYDGLSIEL
jgi:ribonuclease BN (tRNA processing enzyme)